MRKTPATASAPAARQPGSPPVNSLPRPNSARSTHSQMSIEPQARIAIRARRSGRVQRNVCRTNSFSFEIPFLKFRGLRWASETTAARKCRRGLSRHRYSTRSPCREMSRPSRSCSSVTRSPIVHVDDLQNDVSSRRSRRSASSRRPKAGSIPSRPTPLISLLANTPVSSAPTMPPTPCTPKASSESSYPSAASARSPRRSTPRRRPGR